MEQEVLDCMAFYKQELSNGPALSQTMRGKAKAFSPETRYKAFKGLKVELVTLQGKKYWSLP